MIAVARARTALTLLVSAVLLAGCSADGRIRSLPFSTGTGEDSYQITVHLADLGNMVSNADVKVDDVTVGTVTEVAFDDWTAKLTVSLERSVRVPANAEARIAQKSLLGAEYLELAPPRHGPAIGELRGGDDIPLARTGHYPATEELLTAMSVFLNHGGVGQLSTITTELNNALVGREGDARELIHNLERLTETLDTSKTDIVRVLESLDRLSGTLAQQTEVIDNALRTIPPGIAALERQRGTLVETLDAVSALGDVASRVVNSSRDDLHANLRDLQPVLGKLADSGKDMTGAFGMLFTFPFASNQAFPAVVNGDYGNLYITVDLDVNTLSDNLLRGFTIADVPLLGGSSLAGGLVNSNPLTEGLAGLVPLPLGQREPTPTQVEPDEQAPDQQEPDLERSLEDLLPEPLIPGGN
jgi:phospholipid/cholesterol/gamma-HCH transport system substrate-binding protein